MEVPILEKAITWALQDTLHLNHKLSFSGLSKHGGDSEAEEILLRNGNQLPVFPKEI